MFTNKKLIIFDMDGTLIDSAPSLAYAINTMLKSLNLPNYNLATIRNWIGNGADILIKRALAGDINYEKTKISEQLFTTAKEQFLKIYATNLTKNAALYDGVFTTLQKLSCNYTLALATNKPHQFVATMLKDFNIEQFFTIALGASLQYKKKPSTQMLLYLSKELNIAPQYCVMVGDSKNDIIAAQNANMDSIALTYGYNQGSNLSILKPTLVCDSFAKIEEFF